MPTLPRRVLLGIYIAFLVIPIYWLVVMSLKTNEEILGELSLVPRHRIAASRASPKYSPRRRARPSGAR